MTSLALPVDYPRFKVVRSFDELLNTPFENGINALCWPRTLAGDFGEVVMALGDGEGIVPLDEERLLSLSVSDAGRTAIEQLLADQRLLHSHGLAPVLDCIYGYPRDEEPNVLPIDVFSFHADSATTEADTWLCTYYGLTSEALRNEEAMPYVEVPEIRAGLLELFGGEDNDEFLEFLNENCFDLHYAPLPNAKPFSFGLGNLWRIATDYPGSPVPPCVHRAPNTVPGDLPRLLLIS